MVKIASTLTTLYIVLNLFTTVFSKSDDLPTSYEHYSDGGISSGLNADQKYFLLNGKNITIFSGAFHYFRVHPSQWRDRLRKMRAGGLNAVETYVAWNLHEYNSGVYDFGNGGSDFEEFLDITKFIKTAQEEDLFVLVRAGPYICAEWEFGGLPSWLLREPDIKPRSGDSVFLNYVSRYYEQLFVILSPLQFTNGGAIIALQIENEYGNLGNKDSDYLLSLAKIFRDNGIKELLYTSDPPIVGSIGALPNEILMTANLDSDAISNLNQLDSLQTNKPDMVMEFYSGWFDHVGEDHHTSSADWYRLNYEEIITFPASVNVYMFVGSTNFGFTNGANGNGVNNSELQPDTTSYDYDSPITETGEITCKFNVTAELISKYNPVKTRLPKLPETPDRILFDDIKLKEQILLSEIIDAFPNKIFSEKIVSMEQLPINNNSGQSFGYIVYRKHSLNISAKAVLKLTGYVRDHVLVLLNGKLLTPELSSIDDLYKFGYWRVKDSTLTLTEKPLENATLDLIVENGGRHSWWSINDFQHFKGLIDDVLIDDRVLSNWEIVPLEFKRSWNQQLSGWHAIQTRDNIPALYRVSFTATAPLRDTFVNVQEWRKGIVIINGFVLGRVFAIGPQQALYLPSGLLKEGINELIIFEHFSAPEYVKFTKDHIWGKGTNIH